MSTDLPPCYAMVHPGLEPIAADEITQELGGTVRKTTSGLVVFRVDSIDEQLLRLRTVEDVYLLAWGTDQLTFRASDLKSIRRWSSHDVDWDQLIRLHHAVHPKPKGKPTFRIVTQMAGKHVYRRIDAAEALAKSLAGKLPASWKPAEENAAIEFWLTIRGKVAICGIRLSDRTMRHRTYKLDHLPASLRPTVAAAMVRLAAARGGQVVLDPACGAGTVLAEQLAYTRAQHAGRVALWGGDLDAGAIHAAKENLLRLGPMHLCRWDLARLPFAPSCVDRLICNLPFGKQIETPVSIGPLYQALAREGDRVLKPEGIAVLLVSEMEQLRHALRPVSWIAKRQLGIRILGQEAVISVWQKPAG